MAVVFYMPEAGADDSASSGHGSAGSGSAASSTSQSPNTTTSATQTPMQSPLLTSPHIVMALCEAVYQSWNNTPAFQYPPPASPCCHIHSPSPYTGSSGGCGGGGGGGGEVFFPPNRSTPRTPRTSVSFAAGEETTFFRHHNISGGCSSSAPHLQPPQSAPPMPASSHAGAHSQTTPQQYQQYSYPYHQYTPPPTPLTANASTSTSTTCTGNMFGSTEATTHQRTCVASTSTSTPSCVAKGHARLHRSFSDAQKRSRRTSTAKDDERECHSEHETSWDEFDDRYENFTAGRERLQEFNGRIPPRKKKKDVPKSKAEKKFFVRQFKTFIWPTVVSVIVVAIGCGFLVAR